GDRLALAQFDKVRVMIFSLPGKDVPIIETSWIAGQMPFPDHAGVIAGLLQHLRNCRLAAIKTIEHSDAVDMAVLAGQNGRATGRANRVDGETIEEPHPFVGNSVQVGRFVDSASVTAHRMRRMIVSHDEQNVWTLLGGPFRSKSLRSGRQYHPEDGA